VYPAEDLEAFARMLSAASERIGRPVHLISDEAYCRIVYDGRECPTATAHYPHSFLVYTYGKTLLTPGMRMGYLALPPSMPDRETMRSAVMLSLIALGFGFMNALAQHALPDVERLVVDVGHLQAKRDRMVGMLRALGYECNAPEGTFYMLVRSPIEDDAAFVEALAGEDVFVLPGWVVELPGYFRISLTASDDMIERSRTGFERALARAGAVAAS
jgi:aspartate aminotransferase